MSKVNITKCPIPVIWIDTSLIIKLALMRAQNNLNHDDSERLTLIYDRVYDLVRMQKIICPLGQQQEEIWRGEEVCHDIAIDLSLGIRFKHRFEIEKLQLFTILRAYIEQDERINLNYRDVFINDPIKEIIKKTSDSFIVTILPMRIFSIEQINNKRMELKNKLETLKASIKSKNVTYEQQLAFEYSGYFDALKNMIAGSIRNQINGLPLSLAQFEAFSDLNTLLLKWKEYGGGEPELEGIYSFFDSEYYKKIPVVDVQCKLASLLLTDDSNIESGDSMDISHISYALPYSSAIIVDRKMKNRITNLQLEREYDTKVFCLRDINRIEKFFNDCN